MAQNQLVGTSSFAQQGQVDWVQLANSSVSTSVAILSRLSAANVDPFTLAVGHALCSSFKLSTVGQTRLQEALDKLISCSSIGNVIWFGVGVKHVVRHLAQTTSGSSCIVLCATLAEVHSPEFSAMIMGELAELHGAPADLRPSLQQWHHLINSCSGTLAGTNFSCVAEQFMSLSGQFRPIYYPIGSSRISGNLKDLAKALKAMSLVSLGNLTSITVQGGPICGWLAALGYRFLGLEVRIQDSDGTVLDVPLTIVYGRTDASNVSVVSNSYSIGVLEDLLDPNDDVVIAGRVPWSYALSATFGQDGEQLAELPVFGQMVGCIARILTAISKAEPCTRRDKRELERWTGYNDSSFGRGFLNSTIQWLPQLTNLYPSMESHVTMAYAKAVKYFGKAVLAIADVCGCSCCKPASDHRRVFCLLAQAEAVIILIWKLSSLHLKIEIYRSRRGLERVYHLFVESSKGGMPRDDYKKFRDLDWILNHLNLSSVYDTAQLVFAGRIRAPLSTILLASSANGKFFYFGILREISDRPEKAACIHVLPGHIETKFGRRYQFVYEIEIDGSVCFPGYGASLGYPADNVQVVTGLPLNIDTGSGDLKTELIVTETLEKLWVTLQFPVLKALLK
ncbi:MAG: hypothetical protein M1816_004829 [Peltula sp. TS41687]|nr:MAG: hypothetical protein M1816_004829 [Peltula sp. TS41687]